ELADGDGFSMELPDAFSDNSDGSNWMASSKWGGSPGELNLIPDFDKISINEILALDSRESEELYLGASSWLEIYNDGLVSVDLGGCKFSLNDGSEYVIPVGYSDQTSLLPKSYLVFIFNSDAAFGANHVPLSWAYDGDAVLLSRYNNSAWSPLDNIIVALESSSTGRYPDGASSIRTFPCPSPGAKNNLASPDLITMKTVLSGERLPIILWKDDLPSIERSERNASVEVISGSADLRDSSFPLIEGVGSLVTKVTTNQDFIIQVGEWGDTTGIHVEEKRHIFHLDNYILFDQTWSSDHDYYIDLDLEIRPGVDLTILPGTRVFLKSGVSITVSGSLKVMGTRSNPVLFAPQSWADSWGQIIISAFSGESFFQYAIIIGGGGEDDKNDGHTSSQAVVKSSYADINMNNCFILDNVGKGIYAKDGVLNLSNSLISRSDAGVDAKAAYLNISNTYFTYLPDMDALLDTGENDAIFSAGANAGNKTSSIVNNVMAYIRDDAVDLYDGASMMLSGGNIRGVGDKAISVTESDFDISYTLIQKSDEGLVAKENAVIIADHLTLFENNTSLHAYTNNAALGHGQIDIDNSIVVGSVDDDLTVADGSAINVTYTISDRILHPGVGNILGNPLLVNPSGGDFALLPASPAIDAGNPSSPLDADGSRTDLGAFIGESAPASPLVINEIMYSPKTGQNVSEFIEIYNNGLQSLDISAYYFVAGIDFEFPQGTILSGGEYCIVTKQASVYQGDGYQVFQWSSGGLSNSGEEVSLMNSEDELLDIVSYGNSGSWPITPNGMGPSLELKGTSRDNSLSGNWRASYKHGGTPGSKNSSPSQDGVIINEFMARNWTSIKDDTGENVDWAELFNASDNYVQLNGLFLSKYDNDLLYYEITGSDEELLLGPGEYILFWLDDLTEKGAFHTNFELAGSGGFLALSRSTGGTVTILDSIHYSSMSADVSYGRFPDASGDWVTFDHSTPGSSNNVGVSKVSGLHINEIMARNSSVYLNDIGEYDDWIELYNSTNEAIDVGGLYFSDSKSDPLKYRIPSSSPQETTVEPKGFLMLFPSAKPDEGIRHLNFQLAGNGEIVSIAQVYLGETVLIDSVTYPGLPSNKTWGRTNDGGQYWIMFDTPTPDATNGTNSIDDFEAESHQLLVYPNPATDLVHIRLTNDSPFDYQIEIISPLSQTIRTLDQGRNNPAYSQVLRSFSINELGSDTGSCVFFRIRINEQYYIRKILIFLQ
ncbi:MAG: lamin tail domain-containing protein, partial [Bacteroidales bacterium]|nr:lamin tail domain-containing protein [Bacteroidales bacterium]